MNDTRTTVSLDTPSQQWSMCGNRVPKNQVTYWTQIVLVYGIVIASIAHLSLQSPDKELWLVLLSSSLGYILPSPGLKFKKIGLDETDSKK